VLEFILFIQHHNRVADVLDPDLVYVYVPEIRLVLDVFEFHLKITFLLLPALPVAQASTPAGQGQQQSLNACRDKFVRWFMWVSYACYS